MILPDGHRLHHVASIDSTNAEARRQFEQAETGPVWIWADEQTGGRGRLGRHWVSEPGNLYVTHLFQTAAPAYSAAQLGFVAALAVHDTIRALLPRADLLLKWPNDVLLDGAKVCGLLAEILHQQPLTLALGCGINIAHSPQGLPYAATSLGHDLTPATVLATLAGALSDRLKQWDESRGFSTIRQEWLERAIPIGTVLSINNESGSFAGLAENGALLLRKSEGHVKEVHAGDVQLPQGATL